MAISTCRACGEIFKSDAGFRTHRIGKYEKRDERAKLIQRNTRRCMTIADMRKKGMLKDGRGRWITGERPQQLTLRFTA